MVRKKDGVMTAAGRLRTFAEKQLLKNPAELHAPHSDESIQHLVHELEVHQIELEMQNSELRKARDELETALERCTDLYDFAPVGYVTLDPKGAIIAANLTAATLLGVDRSQLIKQHFTQLISASNRSAFTTFLDNVFAHQGQGTFEVSLREKGIHPLFVQIEAMAAVSGQKCRLALIDITVRKLAEDALRESEERMYRLTEMAAEAVIMLDGRGGITFCNAAAERMFGYSSIELAGREFQSLFFPERLQARARDIFARFKDQGAGPSICTMTEVVALRKDGSEFTLELSVSALNIKGTWHAIAIMRDVTERRRQETEVQDARKYAESIVNAVRRPLVVLNSSLEILSANLNFYSTFKVTPEETVGRFIYEIGDRQWDIPQLRTLFIEVLDHDSVFNRHEVEHDFPVIGRKNILLNARRIFKESIGSHLILLAMEDITERIQAEKRISEVVGQQQAILDNIPNMAWLLDAEGRYVAVNDSFSTLHGILPADIVGKTAHDIYPPELAAKYEQDFRKIMATGQRTYLEDSIIDQDGNSRYVEKIKTPIFDDAGTVIGMIGIAHDITRHKEVEVSLRHGSTHDILTGLYNRAFFEEELERLAHSRMFPLSIVMADVNGLKIVNDTQGHIAGDSLLRLAARIILEAFRAEDTVARIGGDEFVVLLPGTDEKLAVEAVERIKGSHEIKTGRVSIAFGIASADSKDQISDALRLGDERMYQDKLKQKESWKGGR